MFERGCIESQVSERGHFKGGFLWPRAKKTTDSAARRALRARGGRFRKYKAEDFWREDFLEGRTESLCAYPAHPCARTTHSQKRKPPDEPKLVGSFSVRGRL